MTHTRTAWIALCIALLTIAAACGTSSEETTTTDAPTTTESPDTTQAAATTEPAVVEVTAVDFGYVGLPETIAAGTRLVMKNESTMELHEMVAIRLPDEMTMPIGDFVKLPMEELGPYLAEPTAVLIAPPSAGESIPVVGDGVLSEPGRYAIICLIPTGADPDEYLKAAAESEGGPPQVDGGPPHIANGMYAEITVTG